MQCIKTFVACKLQTFLILITLYSFVNIDVCSSRIKLLASKMNVMFYDHVFGYHKNM